MEEVLRRMKRSRSWKGNDATKITKTLGAMEHVCNVCAWYHTLMYAGPNTEPKEALAFLRVAKNDQCHCGFCAPT